MDKNLHLIKFLLILLIGLAACQKEDFTSPVTVNLQVAIADGYLSHLKLDRGMVLFRQIKFDGERNQGGDVHFLTDEKKMIGPIQFTDNSSLVKSFDIPQGVYSYKKWRFELEELDDDYLESLSDEQLEDLEGGLILRGVYTKKNGTQLPLFIVVDEEESFLAASQPRSGDAGIALLANQAYSAVLTFDPYYAMQSISIQSLEEAEVSNEDDGNGDDDDDDESPYIEISKDENETLYQIVLSRLQQSVKVIIN